MSDDRLDYPFIVAVVQVAGFKRSIRCNSRLTGRLANLLYTLAEHIGRPIPYDDLCHRLRVSKPSVHIYLGILRKKLHYDWLLECPHNRGVRLCYIGTPFSEADRIHVELEPIIHGRVGLPHSMATKIAMSEGMYRAWEHKRAAKKND